MAGHHHDLGGVHAQVGDGHPIDRRVGLEHAGHLRGKDGIPGQPGMLGDVDHRGHVGVGQGGQRVGAFQPRQPRHHVGPRPQPPPGQGELVAFGLRELDAAVVQDGIERVAIHRVHGNPSAVATPRGLQRGEVACAPTPYHVGPIDARVPAGADSPRLVADGRMKIRRRPLHVEQQRLNHRPIMQPRAAGIYDVARGRQHRRRRA